VAILATLAVAFRAAITASGNADYHKGTQGPRVQLPSLANAHVQVKALAVVYQRWLTNSDCKSEALYTSRSH